MLKTSVICSKGLYDSIDISNNNLTSITTNQGRDSCLYSLLSWYWVAGLDGADISEDIIETGEGGVKETTPRENINNRGKYLLESSQFLQIQCKVNWPETDNNAPADARAQCFCNFSSHQWSSNWHNWFVFFYLTISTTQHRTSGSSAVGTGDWGTCNFETGENIAMD